LNIIPILRVDAANKCFSLDEKALRVMHMLECISRFIVKLSLQPRIKVMPKRI
jgi:hypothetical protein